LAWWPPFQTVEKTACRGKFSGLSVPAQGLAVASAILRRLGIGYPSRNRGIAFLLNALGVNGRFRMSKVQPTVNPYCTEPRTAGSCRSWAGFAARHAITMSSDFSLSPIGHMQGPFESGWVPVRSGTVTFPACSRRVERTGAPTASAPSPWKTAADSHLPADISGKSCQASAKNRSSRRADLPQYAASGGFRTAKSTLRRPNSCERGLKLCR